ncbi:MAG: DUF1592 domain-containing protein [Bryobacteraceae bacterium]|nr:DUF1592 domain-containing protein [Bryobacteraceae bacterium]
MRNAILLPLAAWTALAGPFESGVQPVLTRACAGCHNAKLSSGGLNVEALLTQPALADRDRWESIVRRVRAGEMPPKGAHRPQNGELERAITWVDEEYARRDRAAKPDPGLVTVRRLNRLEYANSVRDLLGIDLMAGEDFPVDPYGYGFDNIGDVLSVSPVLTEKYLKTAERIARAAIPVDSDKPKPAMDRYLAERMGQDRMLRLSVHHVFPASGEYVLRSAWYQALRNGTRVRLRLFLDGREVASRILSFYYEMDRGLDSPPLTVPAGRHKVEAEIEVLPEPAYKGSPPYLEYIQIYGPSQVTPAARTAAYQRLFTCGHAPGAHARSCARRILEPLARRAYRRPPSGSELDDLLGLVHAAQTRSGSLELGLRAGLQAILVSPNFLFRVERDASPGTHRITDYELAARLSYFLWSSLPDEELLGLAEKGRLGNPAVLRGQVARMLADPKSRALVESFTGQWLQTRNLSVLTPDARLFPEFDALLREDMRTETEMFFEAILKEDRSILDFLDARFTFLNERLARHYGLEGVTGPHFRRVELDGVQRSGVLTHASVLTVSSYPTRTSPVIRGKWVLENILNAPPPPPPPNVPELNDGAVGVSVSLRQQLEQHRANAVCASCHGRMDPLGFGLENYDAVGKWRTMDGKFAIDASGELPGGKKFAKPAELKQILAEQKDAFTRGLAEKMLTYALGRGLEARDRPAVRRIATRVAENGHRFSALIRGIVESVPFQMRSGVSQ